MFHSDSSPSDSLDSLLSPNPLGLHIGNPPSSSRPWIPVTLTTLTPKWKYY